MANISMFGSVMEKLADIITGFFAIIPQSIYFIYTSIGSLIDMFQFVIRKLAGLDVYYVSGASGLEEKTGDIVTELIEGILGINNQYSALNTVFWSMIIFGVIVLFVMTIITIIKAHYNYDAKKSQPTYIIKCALKSIATMAVIPITVLFGLYLNSAIFQALDTITTVASDSQLSELYEDSAIDQLASATKGKSKVYSSYDFFTEKEWSNTTTFSGMLFDVAAHDANRVRYGAYSAASGEWDDAGLFYLDNVSSMSEDDAKERIAQQIDFAFENNLTLLNSKTIELNGSESISAIASSLTFGPSAAYAFGLINVSNFSKFNVGLVWYYYNLWAFNYIIAFAAIGILMTLLVNIIFGMMLRLLITTILFIVYPPVVGITPLDDGNAVKSWRSNFISYAISAYTTVVSMNLFFMILPLMRSISFFNSPFLDGLVSIIIIIAGLTMIKNFVKMMAGFVGAKDIDEMGQGVRKDAAKPVAQGTTALVKMGGAAVTAARIEYGVRKNISNNINKNRASKIYKLKKKQQESGLTEEETKRLARLERNKKIHEAPSKAAAAVGKFGAKMLKGKGVKRLKRLGNAAQKVMDNDIGKFFISRFGIPVDTIPKDAWVDHVVEDENGNAVLDENGDPVTEKVIYAKDKDGGIALDDKGKPIIAAKKKSGISIIKDAMLDLTGTTLKAVGDLSGAKKLIDSQSGAIDAAKTKINELAAGLTKFGESKDVFKTKKQKDDEKKDDEEQIQSTMMFEQKPTDIKNMLDEINGLVRTLRNSPPSSGSGGGSGGSGSGGP